MEQVTLTVRASKASHLPPEKPSTTAKALLGPGHGLQLGPGDVCHHWCPDIPPYPSLACLVTRLFIYHPANTHLAPIMCQALLSALATWQGAGHRPALAALRQQKGQTTSKQNHDKLWLSTIQEKQTKVEVK